MGRKKIYQTEEEKKEHMREYAKQYQHERKEEKAEYDKQRYQDNKEKLAEYQKQYRQTPMGRANKLLGRYRHSDKEMGRGECTIPNTQWIMDNIFPKPCHWCGEVGWEIMGCDLIDNELPHTPDNVNPCCEACNKKRGKKSYEEFKEALRAKETIL